MGGSNPQLMQAIIAQTLGLPLTDESGRPINNTQLPRAFAGNIDPEEGKPVLPAPTVQPLFQSGPR